MEPEEFIRYFGFSEFMDPWPIVRRSLRAEELKSAAFLDVLWSRMVSGTWNLKPLVDLRELPKREKEMLFAAIRLPGTTKYALSKR